MSDTNPDGTPVTLDEIKAAIKKALTDGQPSEAFCKGWPSAQAALEELKSRLQAQADQMDPPVAVAIKSLEKCIQSVIDLGAHFFEKCPQ